jgi:NadR type nicotinamide-nucleotide adenylyltransferase
MEENLTQDQSLIKRVVICGPESTGKSTMIRNLAAHFKTNFVDEFARDFLQNKWNNKQEVCSKEDLLEIVKGQLELENLKIKKSSKLIFCDTNILTTIAWSKTHFNEFCDPWIQRKAKTLKYDYYLILNTDIPWVKDDLRDRPKDREKMFLAHKKELDYASVNYDIINGSDFQKRLYAAIDYIKNKF